MNPEERDGHRIVVMFVVEERGEWLVWGTARVEDDELYLDTPEVDISVPLPGGLDRARHTGDLDWVEGAEFLTAVYVGVRPDHVSPEFITRTGLRFD